MLEAPACILLPFLPLLLYLFLRPLSICCHHKATAATLRAEQAEALARVRAAVGSLTHGTPSYFEQTRSPKLSGYW